MKQHENRWGKIQKEFEVNTKKFKDQLLELQSKLLEVINKLEVQVETME